MSQALMGRWAYAEGSKGGVRIGVICPAQSWAASQIPSQVLLILGLGRCTPARPASRLGAAKGMGYGPTLNQSPTWVARALPGGS